VVRVTRAPVAGPPRATQAVLRAGPTSPSSWELGSPTRRPTPRPSFARPRPPRRMPASSRPSTGHTRPEQDEVILPEGCSVGDPLPNGKAIREEIDPLYSEGSTAAPGRSRGSSCGQAGPSPERRPDSVPFGPLRQPSALGGRIEAWPVTSLGPPTWAVPLGDDHAPDQARFGFPRCYGG
jgi:hypothetical protein